MYPNRKALRRDVARRLRRGESMVLYGPRGIGKTTLLEELEARMRATGIPCARAPDTRCLDDVTRALEAAYPAVDTQEVSRRTARSRLWSEADLKGGVLLLDHLTLVTRPMVSFLRRLRGGVMGVLSAVDVEVERERQRLRPWRLGGLSVRMPPAPGDVMHRLLQQRTAELQLPRMNAEAERRLVSAAQGRPGWMIECTRLLADQRYWMDDQPFVTVVSTDTDLSLRAALLDFLPPMDPAQDGASAGDEI